MMVSTVVGPFVARGLRNCIRHNVVTQTGMRYYASQPKNQVQILKILSTMIIN